MLFPRSGDRPIRRGGCARFARIRSLWRVWTDRPKARLHAAGILLSAATLLALAGCTQGQAPAARGREHGSGATPVRIGVVSNGDVHVYLSALGTVTPLETVEVRSRVDGQLMSVHFTEGQRVSAGDLLAQIDPRPFQVQLEQAEAQLARDQALLSSARIDLKRYRGLLQEDSIAQQQVATQASLVQQYQGTVKLDKAQIADAQLQLDYTRITAPISGRLGLRLVDPGNVVHASDAGALVVITRLEPIGVVFPIPQAELPKVLGLLDARTPVPTQAFGRDPAYPLASGRLAAVDNQIDTATGTVKLKAEFPNADGRLFPNQFVNVRLLVDTLHQATLVPTSAVQRGTKGQYVFLVGPADQVALRLIEAGPGEGDLTSVRAGLAPGDRVVVDGVDRLRDGAKITPISAENRSRQRAESSPPLGGPSQMP